MINLEGAMALDSEAGAVAARVFNRSGTDLAPVKRSA
jgi:hypothetical protein